MNGMRNFLRRATPYDALAPTNILVVSVQAS